MSENNNTPSCGCGHHSPEKPDGDSEHTDSCCGESSGGNSFKTFLFYFVLVALIVFIFRGMNNKDCFLSSFSFFSSFSSTHSESSSCGDKKSCEVTTNNSALNGHFSSSDMVSIIVSPKNKKAPANLIELLSELFTKALKAQKTPRNLHLAPEDPLFADIENLFDNVPVPCLILLEGERKLLLKPEEATLQKVETFFKLNN